MKRFNLIGLVTAFWCLSAAAVVAPDFTVKDITGKTHHLYEYTDKGKMVVVCWFQSW